MRYFIVYITYTVFPWFDTSEAALDQCVLCKQWCVTINTYTSCTLYINQHLILGTVYPGPIVLMSDKGGGQVGASRLPGAAGLGVWATARPTFRFDKFIELLECSIAIWKQKYHKGSFGS